MLVGIAVLVISGAIVWLGLSVVAELKSLRREMERSRLLDLITTFREAAGAAADPRGVLMWEPTARAARQLFPAEFAQLDRVSGSTFPFGRATIEAAHAKWTADWLSWERTHDAEYKLKATIAEQELAGTADQAVVRARLDAIEHEKLDRYQRRYEEYVKLARALQALVPGSGGSGE